VTRNGGSSRLASRPAASFKATVRPVGGELFDPWLLLTDQKILLQGWDLPVVLKLFSPVVCLCGVESTSTSTVGFTTVSSVPSANWSEPQMTDSFRVGVKSGRLNLDSEVSIVRHAVTVFQPVTQFASKIGRNSGCVAVSACHGKHFTVQELALDLRGAFDLQVFGFG